MFQQLLTICRNTFLESIRQPIFVVLLIAFGLLLVLNPAMAANTLDDDNKLMIAMGLSTLFLAGLFLAAFTATGVLASEIDNKTVLTVVSKPVSRPVFVLGKFAGVAAALAVAFWILGGLFLLTVRHRVMQTASDPFDLPVIVFGTLAWFGALAFASWANYFQRRVFTSTFVLSLAAATTVALLLVLMINKHWEFQPITTEFDPGSDSAMPHGQLPIVMLLLYEAILMLTAVAIAASTRLGQIMTLVICSGVFLLGLVSEILLAPAVHRITWADVTGAPSFFAWALPHLLYWVVPNFQFLWLAEALQRGVLIPPAHILMVSAYAILEIIAVLALAIALFQEREVS